MLTKLREPFGKAGLIVAIVALIAALGGGAYAASGGLNGKQKKEVTAIAKKYAGKNGTNGTNGAVGSNGTAGTNGSPGGAGAAGKSVEAFEIAKNLPACGGRGGAEYEVEGSGEAAEICNGAAGSPWTVGGLPQGATETGVWTVSASPAIANGAGHIFVPISFSVPLSQAIPAFEGKVHFVPATGEGVCTGSVTEPTAPEGELCIYWTEMEGLTFQRTVALDGASANGASKPGTVMIFKEIQEEAYAYGSWAVTEG